MTCIACHPIGKILYGQLLAQVIGRRHLPPGKLAGDVNVSSDAHVG